MDIKTFLLICIIGCIVPFVWSFVKDLYKKVFGTKEKNYSPTVAQHPTQLSTREDTYPQATPIELIEFYERKQFDEMRSFLQQIAYGLVGKDVPQQDKDDFKAIMTFFARRDPLYQEIIKKAIVVIAKEEGILQSKIYPYLGEYGQEAIRYVLYFGHELGDVRRIKKGRSYELYTK